MLNKRLHIINDNIILTTSWKQAMHLVHDVDVKDVSNIALTIELEVK